MSKVAKLIMEKKLTPCELESLREVIKECEEREKRIGELTENLRKSLEDLFETLSHLFVGAENLSKSLDNLIDKVEELYVLSLPREKFYSE